MGVSKKIQNKNWVCFWKNVIIVKEYASKELNATERSGLCVYTCWNCWKQKPHWFSMLVYLCIITIIIIITISRHWPLQPFYWSCFEAIVQLVQGSQGTDWSDMAYLKVFLFFWTRFFFPSKCRFIKPALQEEQGKDFSEGTSWCWKSQGASSPSWTSDLTTLW